MSNEVSISNHTTPFENILASYLDEKISLSEKDQELKKRWESAFSLLLNFHSREQATKKLMALFNISMATAYRDISSALQLFGDINKSRKEGWRYIIFEYNQNLFQMATKEKALEVMGKCLDRMIKLAELDKEEGLFNPEKLANMEITIGVNKAFQKAVQSMNSKGVVDLNNFEVEDIPHEDIVDNG